jgi:hypothetical protein
MHVKWRRFAATVAIALLLWVVYTFRPISISVDNCQFFVTTIFDQAPLQYDFANRRSIQHFFSRWQRYARCSETYQEDAEPSCGPLACGAWNGTVQQYNSLLHDNKERKLIAELQGGDKACKSAKGKAKRRVLFLTSLHSFHTHMDRWFYHLFYDATIYSQWDVYIWGLGYAPAATMPQAYGAFILIRTL